MKERGHSHSSVADHRKHRTNSDTPNDEDGDDDWDFGVGKLVIDLEADANRTQSPQKATMSSPTKPEKSLKVKIKRKGAKSEGKHEIIKEARLQNLSSQEWKSEKMDKSKSRSCGKKDKSSKEKAKTESNGQSSTSRAAEMSNVSVDLERMPIANNTQLSSKKASPDPYEFKVEDKSDGMPMKKIKLEKESPPQRSHHSPKSSKTESASSKDVSTETSSVGTITDPDCLGPCEPGTSVTLEGLVWHETENGVLVLNVSWRGRTYVGTLLDATKHNWAPPRLTCDSPTSDLDARTPKGRGKRKAAMNTPGSENYYQDRRLRGGKNRKTGNQAPGTFASPASPAKAEPNGKRRARNSETDASEVETRAAKRGRMASNTSGKSASSSRPESPTLIECPEPNCNKKYRHVNGLRYHQSHAHRHGTNNDEQENSGKFDDAPEEKEEKTSKVKKEEKEEEAEVKMEVDEVKQEMAVYDSISLSVEKDDRTIASKTVDMKTKVLVMTEASKVDKNGNSAVFEMSGSSSSVVSTSTATVTTADTWKPKAEKVKVKTTLARPIMPAPIPQVSALKPIQPKPTIMGEQSSLNPALINLKQEKKHKKKKSKERGEETPVAVVPPAKDTETTVIKESRPEGTRPEPRPEPRPETRPDPKPEDLTKTKTQPEIAKVAPTPKVVTNSSSDKASCGAGSPDANSPAYSDISDANEAAPSPDTEEGPRKGEDKPAAPPSSNPVPSGFMYPQGYYNQQAAPYMVTSPGQKSSLAPSPKESCSPQEERQKREGESSKSTEPERPPTSPEQQMRYLQYQQMVGPYGYHPDPAIQHLLATDPRYYHERMMAEQRQRESAEGQRQREGAERPRESAEGQSPENKRNEASVIKPNKPPALIHDAEKERNMKQNENHQILKENIELKQQMEKENLQRSNGFDKVLDKQRDELERYHHVLQQPEHRKLMESEKPRDKPSPNEARRLDTRPERDIRSPQDRLRNESPHSKSSSPRTTPKPKSSSPAIPGLSPASLGAAYPHQYYPHAYLQSSPYGSQVPPTLDPSHPLYRNPAVLGYPQHPFMLSSSAAASDAHRKAAEIQQRAAAAQYYGQASAFMASQQAGLRHPFGHPK